MERCIVEASYDKPFAEDKEKAAAGVIDAYLARYGGSWVRSYYSKDRHRLICEFFAPSEELVRNAWEKAELPFDVIWSADVFEKEPTREFA